MRKDRAGLVEVYNDLDGEIVSLFRVLRDPALAADLARRVRFTPYAREEFQQSYEPVDDPVEQARRTMVRAFQGFGSDSASGAQTGFRSNGNRSTAHPAKDWSNLPAAIDLFCARLAGVVIEHRRAVDVMLQHDSHETLHYCDPPYLHETRSDAVLRAGKGYRYEMSEADHRELADTLHSLRGMVVISGYDSDLYRTLFPGWTQRRRETYADGALERTEVLWLNPACSQALEQSCGSLFDQEAHVA